MTCSCVESQGCSSHSQPASQSGQGMSRGQGRARDSTEEPWSSLEKGRAPGKGLTCTPHGSAPGRGPGPQAACATWAAGRSGKETGAAPSENGAAGSGHQGAGSVAGPWRTDGIRVARECSPHGAAPSQELSPWREQPSLTSLSLAYPLGEAGEAVTEPGKVGGTVGRKEADCGTGVGPGQLQAGPHHGQQVGTPGRQCLLQPAVGEGIGEEGGL